MRSFLFTLILFPFVTFSQTPYNAYYGNLHSHTDYSGGVENPRYAYIYARDTAFLDFLAVTDHLEGIYYSSYEWDSTKIMADEVTVNGTFVGIAGYEWTSPTYNHCNVYNTPNKVSVNNLSNWSAFVQSVINELPAFAQFNHPGMIGSNDWNSLTYISSLADSVFALLEINNAPEESGYINALDSNWHVSPSNGQDNHNADWGTLDDGRTGIWAEQLTRTDLFNAIKAGRTFATFDKNASVWMDINGTPMGGRIPYNSSVPIHIVLNDADAEVWDHIYLVGAGTQIFLNLSNHTAVLDTVVYINPTVSKWIYLRAEQADGQNIYSAPFYFLGIPVAAGEIKGSDLYLSVYPDPSSGEINISSNGALLNKNAMLTVFNRVGSVAAKEEIRIDKEPFTISFDEIKNGVYYYKLETPDAKYSGKIVIIK
jgi:hypothetical protein